ncbi:MAG: shikimate dehydrogenase [Methylibium sp.]|uniref:shikimate dehydrogenase n=1 Tax=Methylibium sp. TaxID=2067992 RepID=UPI0017C388F4|nr:shikimate dehydrogenase [Methylibium sp.]MBA3596766.1 shikimate dehydrogenase [Methylibium sp.]
MSGAGKRDRYAVAGNPVEHSRSPFIHARFAELTGEALSYGRLSCPLDRFAETVRAFSAGQEAIDTAAAASPLAAPGPARGCNVTVPFKFEAAGLAQRLTPRAALAQAANTLRFDPPETGGWQADNTDGAGLVADITVHAGVALAGASLLLIGAGGAAAGVLGPLIEAGPRRLVLANRSPQRAQALVLRHAALAAQHGVELADSTLDAAGSGFDIVVNASAASLQGAPVPVSGRVLRRGCLALDMMYGPAADAFLVWAREGGAQGRDGLGMLVEQAAESFLFWRGVRPPTAEVLAELRDALAAGRP